MDLKDAAQAWQTDGFVILPGFLPAEELTSAVQELGLLFPSADGFHDGTDPRHGRFIGDEFAGIDTFPFASTQISLVAVNHRILALAEALLDDDVHLYAAEAWAKYTGAATTARPCTATTSTTPCWCPAPRPAASKSRCSSS